MRNFPDFLSAYEEYAKDNFVPDRFHAWVGRSILAAALERKVSLKNGRVYYVPNIFVMLVSHPAGGKSTAIDSGIELLDILKKKHNPNFRIIPEKTTEPGIVDMMKITDRVAIPGTNSVLPQSAGFFCAREASDSALNGKNTVGDVIAILTALYDCPRWYMKKTQSMPHPIEIENSCMNLLAGSTFNFLRTLVNEQSVLGGFASRLIYIVSPERKIRKSKWGETKDLDSQMGKKLVEDLAHINKLIGPMTPTPGFVSCWESWQPKFDEYLIGLKSERLESIMARKGTNLIKTSILLSISESDSLIVTEKHFERALEIIEDAYKDNAEILATAVMMDKSGQNGMNQFVVQTLKKSGGVMTLPALRSAMSSHGVPAQLVEATLSGLISSEWITINANSVRILIEPNAYL